MACSRGESNNADHIFQWLWKNVEPIQAFDLLMSVAIPKNNIDDHYFVFPGYTWRSFETGVLDKELLPILMRPSVRYAARFPIAPATPELDSLIKDNKLMERVTRQETGDDETIAIGRLGKNHIGQTEEFAAIPVMMASALGTRACRLTALAKRCRSAPPASSCARSVAIRWMSTCTPASICAAIWWG